MRPLPIVTQRSDKPTDRQPPAMAVVPVAFVLLVMLAGCSRPPGRDAADTDATHLVESARRHIELENEVKAGEETLIAAGRRARDAQFGPLQKVERLTTVEQQGFASLLDHRAAVAAKRLQSELEAHDAFVTNEFAPAWEKLAAERLRVAAARDAVERDERKAQQTALALGTENRWFWLSALVAVSSLLALFMIDRRHEIRRYLNGGRAQGLGLGKLLVAAFVLLCVLTAALFLASDGILVDLLERSSGESAATRLAKQAETDDAAVSEIESRLTAQQKEVERLRQELEAECAKFVPIEQAGQLFDDWWAYWKTAAKRGAQLGSLELCRGRFDATMAEMKVDDAAIATARESAAKWRRYSSRLSGVIGVLILALVGTGMGMFVRGVRAREKTLSVTCPLCLAEGKLEPFESYDGHGGGMVRCTNVMSEKPFVECDYDFPQEHRSLAKLSFPTLGIPASGKTFWLAMAYHRIGLREDLPPKPVELMKLRTSASEAVEELVRNILQSKVKPQATKSASLPRPLVFNFSDNDVVQRSSILVNVFDYSGEVYQRMSLEDYQKRLALKADGYLMFVDPTSDAISGLSRIPEQIKALDDFQIDVRAVNHLQAGEQLCRPIAICVPKIDLMVNENYALGGNVVERFYAELSEIGWGMDMSSIRRRSDLMRNLRDTIWPNWNIERAVDDLFGGRYMFFPLTPVGLDDPGEIDLSRRHITPLGLLHPLMWLLHMNGYPVLPQRPTTQPTH